jgi:hypothetical protein
MLLYQQSNFPPNLLSQFQEYLRTAQDLAAIHAEINDEVKEFEEKIMKVKSNIFDETEPD